MSAEPALCAIDVELSEKRSALAPERARLIAPWRFAPLIFTVLVVGVPATVDRLNEETLAEIDGVVGVGSGSAGLIGETL